MEQDKPFVGKATTAPHLYQYVTVASVVHPSLRKKRRKRHHIPEDKKDVLEQTFNTANSHLTSPIKQNLAMKLGLPEYTIGNWFQNKKRRIRKEQRVGGCEEHCNNCSQCNLCELSDSSSTTKVEDDNIVYSANISKNNTPVQYFPVIARPSIDPSTSVSTSVLLKNATSAISYNPTKNKNNSKKSEKEDSSGLDMLVLAVTRANE